MSGYDIFVGAIGHLRSLTGCVSRCLLQRCHALGLYRSLEVSVRQRPVHNVHANRQLRVFEGVFQLAQLAQAKGLG